MPEKKSFIFRRFVKRSFIWLNVLVALVFLLALLLPIANPHQYWWLGLFGLAFPYLLLGMLFFTFFWLVMKPKYALVSLLPILISWKQVGAIFSFKKDTFEFRANPKFLRILTWNVRVFEGLEKGGSNDATSNILGYIKAANPDVICLQEFSQYDSAKAGKDHIKKMKEAGYTNYFFSKDYQKKSIGYQSGVAIFSKHILFDTTRVPLANSPESVIYADVKKGDDTVRVFTTHLQSFKFNNDDYQYINDVTEHGDVTESKGKNFISKMHRAFELRAAQALQMRPMLDSSPFPEIICGDFNSVPNSYAYWQIRGSRQDAFLENGFGIGRSFISLSPTLRIDYVLCNPKFKVQQFTTSSKKFSDHFPLIVDVELGK